MSFFSTSSPQSNFELAFQGYLQSVNKWPTFPLALFGLGQIYLYKDEEGAAIDHFEKVLKEVPNNYEALKILGMLYMKNNRDPDALDVVQRLTSVVHDDFDGWLMLGQLQERSKPAEALKGLLFHLPISIN